MNYRTIFRLVGVLVIFIGLSMSFSLFWSLYLGEPDVEAILISMGICLVSGGMLFAVGWKSHGPVLRREGMAVVGLMVPLNAGPKQAICQSLVAPEMQGRFFTLNDSVHQLMAPLGLGISGPLADAFGVRVWFVLAALSCLAVALVRALIPSVLYIEDRAPRY